MNMNWRQSDLHDCLSGAGAIRCDGIGQAREESKQHGWGGWAVLLFRVVSEDKLQWIPQFTLKYAWTTQPEVKFSDNFNFI